MRTGSVWIGMWRFFFLRHTSPEKQVNPMPQSVSAPTAMQRINSSTSSTLTAQRGCIFINLCHSDDKRGTRVFVGLFVCPYSSSSSAMLFWPASCLFFISASIAWMSSFITFRLLSGLPSFRERVLFTSAAFSRRSKDKDAERLRSGTRLEILDV